MTQFRLPALDKAMVIVDPKTGRITPDFQRFWQNLTFVAVIGGNQSTDVTALTAEVASINSDITNINVALSGKAPLASPAFTGNPTAPTQAAGNNSTRLATTAFVNTHAVARSTFTPWAAATGTADRTTFDTSTVTLPELAERVKALIDDLKL